jgi:hypothetical protein
MFMENLFSQSAYFFEFLLRGSHVASGMFRDPKIVVGLMAFWTLLLIAWIMARARVMSPPGTFETSTDVRYTAAFGG